MIFLEEGGEGAEVLVAGGWEVPPVGHQEPGALGSVLTLRRELVHEPSGRWNLHLKKRDLHLLFLPRKSASVM